MFNVMLDGGPEADPRNRDRKVECRALVVHDQGMIVEELTTEEIEKMRMRLRGSRKQQAARRAVPRNTITKIEIKHPAPVPVAMAILEGRTDKEVNIIRMQEEIKEIYAKLAERP